MNGQGKLHRMEMGGYVMWVYPQRYAMQYLLDVKVGKLDITVFLN